jgi:hypothetical protein
MKNFDYSSPEDEQFAERPQGLPTQGGQPYNPFDLGISKAISEARSNLGLTQQQQHRAINNALLNFGNAIAKEPVVSGFKKNLGVFGRAMNPALQSYNQSEDTAIKENNALANQILAHRRAEENARRQDEEREYKRDFAERQFGALEQFRQAKLRQDQAKLAKEYGYNPDLPEGTLPIASRQERALYIKDRKALGTILKEFEELENSYDNFRNDTKENVFDPLSPSGRIANNAKGVLGRFAGIKSLREEEAQRKGLQARLNKFVTTSERALKGGGVLGPTIIKMFKEQGIYPDIDIDSPETIAEKLKSIKDELSTNYKAADMSLQYNAHINPYEVDNYNNNQNAVEAPKGGEVVEMVDQSGEVYMIPQNEVEDALNSGLAAK